ncbi:MAG: 1-acyl-sn-glycerol-3-phosphate acyltransferase, partial [Rhizobiales bacterium]|nr:1-acyl-sn-glycerol-3-phosphate acyltransferase [Hyphomicrobiales bacterium]
LAGGDVLVLFAEGTTGDGIAVLPFRSALVGAASTGAAAGAPVLVQPVAIVYTALQGLPIGRMRMADVAWHGDMDLVPHLLGVIGIGSIDAVVAFGTPIPFTAETDRKAVTAAAEAEVRGLVRALRRRGRSPAPAAGGATPILSGEEKG